MVVNHNQNHSDKQKSLEVIFTGANVQLAGQIDYPALPMPEGGYPLIFVLHHAGGHTRASYSHYADVALESGYAVFRWDKRGTGRSGSGGLGSPIEDAIKAYTTALSQADINQQHVVVLAQGEGSLMLSDIFEDLQPNKPIAALLIGSLLDKVDILKIKTQIQVIIGEDDWISWQVYGRDACEAHSQSYDYGARFSVAHHADRLLKDTRYEDQRFHIGAKQIISDWLSNFDDM